jgi:hypothetical protein
MTKVPPTAKPREIVMVAKKVALHERQSDFAYWQSQEPQTRLAALEEIRREYHGWTDATEPRLQRVLTIVKR